MTLPEKSFRFQMLFDFIFDFSLNDSHAFLSVTQVSKTILRPIFKDSLLRKGSEDEAKRADVLDRCDHCCMCSSEFALNGHDLPLLSFLRRLGRGEATY